MVGESTDVAAALAALDLEKASDLASTPALRVEFALDDGLPRGLIRWEASSPSYCRLWIGHAMAQNGSPRVEAALRLIVAYHSSNGFLAGQTMFNVGDRALVPGLAACAVTPDYTLVPDPLFLGSRAYAATRHFLATQTVPWAERKCVAFWRGGSTGIRSGSDWRSLPRVRLCQLASSHPDLFDVGLTDTWHFRPEEIPEVQSQGLLRDKVHITQFQRYRFHIDVDGNSNSWPGLFQKLLTGCPVLKVDSPHGFRQWYYERLIPWKNYVPVAATMEDLLSKLRWLMQHDDKARMIGAEGAEFAHAVTVETEIARVLPSVSAAMAGVECES